MKFEKLLAALQAEVYFPEIFKIKGSFEAGKIDFLFLKGLPLHLYFEKSPPRRIAADCDVLIAPNQELKVGKIFNRFGYRLAETAYSKLHHRLKDKLTEVTYFKVVNNCMVAFDVHFEVVFLMNQLGRLDSLYPQKSVDEITREFLRHKQQVRIRRQKFPILAPADLIIYLGLHFFHHNFRGRHRLEFWHKVINYYKLRSRHCEESPAVRRRGNLVVKKIERYRLQNFIYPGFILLNKYFPKTLPPRFMAQILPGPEVLKYAAKIVKAANVDKTEDSLTAGINRFKNIFYLSPRPWYRKILVFFNPAVIYSAIWTIIMAGNGSRKPSCG